MTGIEVKGDRDGLIITLPPDDENEVAISALYSHLEQAGAFFKGATVTLDVGERALSQEELEHLRDILQQWEVALVALRADNESTRAVALEFGLDLPFVVTPESAAEREQRRISVPDESVDALLVRRTLRSGQVVRHPGAVVILGDVNPGAEIVAGGDVVVWGTLRGLVHAGAMGDERAMVCAMKLAPTQLRISDRIAAAPDESEQKRLRLWKRGQKRGPEVARLHEGEIVVEAWPGR